ncbi:hypothetical protein MTP99_007799 [Tenebrio molitor]|nr:hypothetical protein MTP99_007799 [Tenebrio molitor]
MDAIIGDSVRKTNELNEPRGSFPQQPSIKKSPPVIPSQEDLQTCQQKCSKLEEDLIRQKISEAETIKSLQAALNAQVNTTVVKDECNLHQIARELSKILKECEPCGECMTLPEDLTTAAQLLKSLTDLIDSKLPKSEDSDHAMNEQLKMSTDVKEKVKNGSDPAITNEEVTAAEGVKETTRNGSDPAVIMDTLEITITQEQTGGSQVEEKVSSTKPESIHTKQSQQEKDDAGESQIQERTSSIKPESQSIHTKSSQQDKAGKYKDFCNLDSIFCGKNSEPDERAQVEEQIPSVKSEPQNISSKKSHDSERGDQRSEKSTKVSEKNSRESVIIADNQFAKPIGSKPKSRTSCKFVKSRKSAEVDQICQKADEPLVLKKRLSAWKLKENFPFDIDTQVDIINRPPDGVHVTTTITNSGTLEEMSTEGPEGVIEASLIYTNSGGLKVVTKFAVGEGQEKTCNRGKIKNSPAVEGLGGGYWRAPPIKSCGSEQGKTPRSDQWFKS